MEAGNAFLPAFVERFNERFSVRAARPENLHHLLNVSASRLSDILCHREQRYVGAQLTFHYDRKLIILEQTDISKASQASTLNSTTSSTDRSRSAGRACCFPSASSARTSV